jgi:hypothetical protein
VINGERAAMYAKDFLVRLWGVPARVTHSTSKITETSQARQSHLSHIVEVQSRPRNKNTHSGEEKEDKDDKVLLSVSFVLYSVSISLSLSLSLYLYLSFFLSSCDAMH